MRVGVELDPLPLARARSVHRSGQRASHPRTGAYADIRSPAAIAGAVVRISLLQEVAVFPLDEEVVVAAAHGTADAKAARLGLCRQHTYRCGNHRKGERC
jgi:hypothetical protein